MELLKEGKEKGAHNIIYPFSEIPEPGRMLKVADGVYWLRMPLPFEMVGPWLIRVWRLQRLNRIGGNVLMVIWSQKG